MQRPIRRLRRWLHSRRVAPETRRARDEGLTYLSWEKLHRLEAAVTRIAREQVPGDLVEFGVALGGSSILLAGHLGTGRRFHGFDVFAMIPPPTSENDDEKSRRRYESIRAGKATGIDGADNYYGYRDNLLDDVKSSFARFGRPVDGDRIQLHKGLFEETWPTVEIDRIAFAHIDCDWYDPVKFCLAAVADRLSRGGQLLIDDYHDYGGARTAVDEFLAARRDYAFEPGANPILRRI
jgi:asparagine synthase (glutamine-hydrolysing)